MRVYDWLLKHGGEWANDPDEGNARLRAREPKPLTPAEVLERLRIMRDAFYKQSGGGHSGLR